MALAYSAWKNDFFIPPSMMSHGSTWSWLRSRKMKKSASTPAFRNRRAPVLPVSLRGLYGGSDATIAER